MADEKTAPLTLTGVETKLLADLRETFLPLIGRDVEVVAIPLARAISDAIDGKLMIMMGHLTLKMQIMGDEKL